MKRSSKCIALLISILLVSFRLFSQVMDVNIPGKDMPAFVRIFENGIVQRYVIPDWEENPVIKLEGQNKTYNIDLGSVVNKNNFSAEGSRSDIYEWYEPGIPVEGDLPCDMAYSRDGSMFAVIYQHSDNVIFYDANSYAILATVRVGRQPLDIKMGVDHAYVCCHLGQEVVVISLNDFSVSNFVQVDGTPCQVELSPTEDTAYIACDSWLDGWMIAMNLQTNQVIYETYVPYFHHYGWGGGLGRELYSITKFKLSPHGDKFICADTTHRATIFNASTGQVEKLFNLGWRGAAYSPTGDTLFIYSNIGDSIKMYRINSADNSVIDFINVYADCFLGLAGYSDLAISHDGSRVMVNDDFNSRFCLFDFNTYTCQLIDEGLLYSDPPTYSTFDGVYGITCTYTQVKFLNFESGEILNTYPTGVNTGMPLCVSPKENKLVVGNLPDYDMYRNDNEFLYAVNFKDIDDITADTAIICGEAPEADVPTCAELSDDGQTIYSANKLTHNLSAIDINENRVDTLLYMKHMTGIKMVPGSDLALVYGDDSGKSWVISLTDYSILAELNTGSVDNAFVTSDGQTAYTIGYAGNMANIKKISIDGTSSSIVNQAAVGGSYSSFIFIVQETTFNTTSALSPDDQLLLIGCDDTNLGPVINIVDAETLDLLTSVPVTNALIYGFAFTDDSKRAIAAIYSSYIPIIYLDRENSHLEHYIHINQNTFSAGYNPVDGLFYILEQNNFIHKVDPITGNIVESFPTGDNYNWRIAIDKRGMPMVLTATSLIYDRDVYPMPGVSTVLTYNSEYDLFISPVPGPDVICVFDPKMVGIQQFKPGQGNEISIFPNPATDQLVIKSSEEITRVKICNMAGSEIYSGYFKERNIVIPIDDMSPGVYLVRITTESGNYPRKIVIKQGD